MTKKLVIYLMAGAETPALAEAAVAGGADMIEFGIPFSDPLADGPVIRAAGEKALAAGMRTAACLECLAATRALVGDTPIIPMTYASLLEAYGWERFETDARAAGATSFIIVDTAAGSRPELKRVQLVAPTSTDERIALAASETDGWLYLVTLTGTTGARTELSEALAGLAARTRAPHGRAALCRLRHLDAGAGPRRRRPHGRHRRRIAGGARRRGRPGRAPRIRLLAAGRARRLRAERARNARGACTTERPRRQSMPDDLWADAIRGAGRIQRASYGIRLYFDCTRSPQRSQRWNRSVRKNHFAFGTLWPSTRQRHFMRPAPP